MTVIIEVNTGGLTKIGKKFTYHIFGQKDIKRVTNKLKEIVKKYPPKTDLYGVGQEVRFYLKAYHGSGDIIREEGILHNVKDVDNLMYNVRRLYLNGS